MTPVIALAVAVVLMLIELGVSNRHEHMLKGLGAVAPPDPVYGTMRWAYPGVFVAMAVEGVIAGPAPLGMVWAGAALFAAAKLFKLWTIASLGHYWTYKVYVIPGAPLVTTGPYRFMRHPNYVAVIGEILSMALVSHARIVGPIGLVFFGILLILRVRAEERALGLLARPNA
jgi:methyltransferase